MLFSHVMLLLVAAITIQRDILGSVENFLQPEKRWLVFPNLSDSFQVTFSFLAIGAFLGSALLPKILSKIANRDIDLNTLGSAELFKRARPFFILSFGLAELVTMSGFVLSFSLKNPDLIRVFFILGVLRHLNLFPSTRNLRKMVGLE